MRSLSSLDLGEAAPATRNFPVFDHTRRISAARERERKGLAPPAARCSAQIVPPWASTSPRAIARPRPAPPFACRAESSRQKRSNIRRAASGVRPFPVSSTVTRTWSGAGASVTATVPSDGVLRSALVSRLRRTRSTSSGAQRASGRPSSTIRSRGRYGRALRPRSRARTIRRGRKGTLLELAGEGACVDARELEEVVDETGQAPRLILEGRRYSVGVARPSSIASSIAAIEATGARRSRLRGRD